MFLLWLLMRRLVLGLPTAFQFGNAPPIMNVVSASLHTPMHSSSLQTKRVQRLCRWNPLARFGPSWTWTAQQQSLRQCSRTTLFSL